MACLLVFAFTACTDHPADPSRTLLGPEDLCSDYSGDAVIAFADATLAMLVRRELGLGDQDDVSCDLAATLASFAAVAWGIEDVRGIQNLTGLIGLNLGGNPIEDFTPIAQLGRLRTLVLQNNALVELSWIENLAQLTDLILNNNSLADLAPIAQLTFLERLWVSGNGIVNVVPLENLYQLESLNLSFNHDLSEIRALLDNPGIGEGDWLDVRGTSISCVDVAALTTKGAGVVSDCP